MEELLLAIRKNDSNMVRAIANELFIRRDGTANKPQINEFEMFAPCKIKTVEEGGWLFCGKIFYSDMPPFTFG